MMPTFANPEWLWCLLLLPPLIGLRVWSHLRARRGAAGLVSPRLTKDLVIGARQWSRWVVFSLQLTALAMLLVALARPQWGFEVTEEESESRNVVIAIDTSRSMLATDLIPDRLTRAKLAAEDIVAALPEDRIALIAFAGKAFVQAPLTLDHDAIIESIQQFDTDLIPRGGSNLTNAAELAVELLEKVDSKESALILFSDGEALEGREELESVVKSAEKVGLTVVAIGVGTDSGSIIPEPDDSGKPQPGVFVTDEQGSVVRTRLDAAAMQEFSRTLGGGVYLDLASNPSISRAVIDALRQIDATRGVSRSSQRPIDRFVWPLSIALGLFVAAWLLPGTSRLIERLAAAMRRAPNPAEQSSAGRATTAVLAFLALTGPSAHGGIGEVESPAYETYRNQQFPEAIESYRRELETAESAKQRAWLNLGLGSAAYQTGDYALAKEAFGRTLAEGDKTLSTRAHYNLANTLFRNGEALLRDNAHPKNPAIAKDDATKAAIATQWQAAQEHYQAALGLNASDANARHNLSVVGQRLELLNQPPPPEEEEQKQENQDQQQDQQQQQQQQQNQQQQQPNQSPPQDSQPGDQPPPDQSDQPQDQPPQDPDKQPGEQPPPGQKQPPGDQPPQKPEPQQPPDEPTPEGELEGKPNQPEGETQAPPPSEAEVNPDTGFSPEEARQRLRTLADEDKDVRPPINLPIQAEKYKNW